jgi:hypothetical protein
VFCALPAAAAVAAFTRPGLVWTIVSAVAAVWFLFGFGLFGKAWEKDSPKAGLLQRAVIIPGWLWVAAVFMDAASR